VTAITHLAGQQESVTFGSRLRRLRHRTGLTQEMLAERAGVSVATVGALEEGQRRRPHPRHWPPLRTRWDSRTTSEQNFWRRQAGHPSHGLNARRNSCRVANGRLTRIRRPHWRRPRHQPPGCGCPCGASRGRSIPSQHYAVYIMWSITNVSSARHRARRCWSASRCGTRVSPGCRQGDVAALRNARLPGAC
jgi:DNA-binding XRE family transcriptional regulator